MANAPRRLKLVALPPRKPGVHVVSERLLALLSSSGRLRAVRKQIDAELEQLDEEIHRLVAIEVPAVREAPHAS